MSEIRHVHLVCLLYYPCFTVIRKLDKFPKVRSGVHVRCYNNIYCFAILSTCTFAQLYVGATFNVVGAILRLVSTIDPIVCSSVYDRSGFVVALIGQILTACAQPFLLYAPTTLAAVWFGPKERAICTNFASVCKFSH